MDDRPRSGQLTGNVSTKSQPRPALKHTTTSVLAGLITSGPSCNANINGTSNRPPIVISIPELLHSRMEGFELAN
eukprot:scaffold3579_cov168-Cylindrotheca_fusiformis.AAC.2